MRASTTTVTTVPPKTSRRASRCMVEGYWALRARQERPAPDRDRPIGAFEELAVTAAVAVRPDERRTIADPGIETARFLFSTHVGAGEPAGEAPVRADLELGAKRGVETESLRDRLQIDRERRRHDDQLVALLLMPSGSVERVGAHVAVDHVVGEARRHVAQPVSLVAGEGVAHHARRSEEHT